MNRSFLVKCPGCGNKQKTSSLKRKKCVYCGRSFVVKGRIIK